MEAGDEATQRRGNHRGFFMVGATVLPAFVLLSLVRVTTFSKSLLMLMSLSEFVLAMGLWKMKNWARVSSAILVIIGFLSGVASLRHPSRWRGFTPWLLAEYVLVFGIDLLMIAYLLSPSVRQAFLTWSEPGAVEWKPWKVKRTGRQINPENR